MISPALSWLVSQAKTGLGNPPCWTRSPGPSSAGPRKHDESVINLNSSQAAVSLIFRYEGNDYKVTRTNPRGNTSQLDLYIRDDSKGKISWNTLTERTLRETDQKIVEILRLDYESFVNASFFLQGEADQFTQQTPASRKRILSKILGLEIWEEYRMRAQISRRSAESELDRLEGRIAELLAELGEEEDRKIQLLSLEKKLDAADGRELFAYVPGLVFPNLTDLASPVYAHRFYVDLSPYVANTGSGTLLVGGLGKGGKGYFCLDVTDAKTMTSESELAGNVKWEYPNASTPSAERADMGYSYSEAYIVKSNDTAHPWVVVFGNGYASTNGHAVLFVLDAFTGVKIAQIDTGVGSCNGLSTPVPVDVDLDYKMDYVYAGDLKGNLWKFDMNGSSASWAAAFGSEPLFQARDGSGAAQPITTKPDVMLHCVPELPGYVVVAATGKYLGNSDFADTQTQTIYGLWDYGDDADNTEYLGTFNRGAPPQLSNQPDTVTLLQQVEVYYGQPSNSNYTLRVLSDYVPEWLTMTDETAGQEVNPSDSVANNAGWYFDLPISKERVIRNLMIRDGKVIFISSIPKSSPCAAGGDSILHEINACTGGRMGSAQFDINDDGRIDSGDMITITIPDPNNPDTTIDIQVPPSGIKYPEMIYPPKIMRLPDGTETKYFSTSSGSTQMLREEGETRGIFYWRERMGD